MTDKELITGVVKFAETAVADFMIGNDYDAAAIAFNMDAENNVVYLSLTGAENQKETFEEYRKLAYLPENVQPHKKYVTISKLPFNVEELWEKPNIASMALLTEEELKELKGDKRVKKFYEICGAAMLDFMSSAIFNELRKDKERFFFKVINHGDSDDIATEYMRKVNRKRG